MVDPGMLFVLALVALPGILGLAALVGAVRLFRGATPGTPHRTGRLVAASVLLVIALGVAACYGMVFMPR